MKLRGRTKHNSKLLLSRTMSAFTHWTGTAGVPYVTPHGEGVDMGAPPLRGHRAPRETRE